MTKTLPAEAQAALYFVPYPPIEHLAVIGDRRTAAIVAADGAVCWSCLPRFDATPIFGALLDLKKGGFWRLGPVERDFGDQEYVDGTAVLTTLWTTPEGTIELTDGMLWPQDRRDAGLDARRVTVRRLRCISGRRDVAHTIEPWEDFRSPCAVSLQDDVLRLQMRGFDLGLWSTHSLDVATGGERATVTVAMEAGDEIWAVLDTADEAEKWTVERARGALNETIGYWQTWSRGLNCEGSRGRD